MRTLLLLVAGCTVGGGEGFVVGELEVPGCDDLEDTFDLQADFFAGEPYDDAGKNDEARRDTLSLRIQRSGNNREVVDGVTIQVLDVESVREHRLVDVKAGCTDPADCPVRASLSLFLTCPQVYTPLLAQGMVACPDDVDVEPLCAGDFADREPYRQRLEQMLPEDAACLVFCDLAHDFNQEVAAAFRMQIIDDRSDESVGWIAGRFQFELARGQAGQTFP